MSIDRTTEILVRNYSASPVAISTKDTQYLIPGGSRYAPAEFPMTLGELIYANSINDAFKIGQLRFEERYEQEVYEALRIQNWRDILTLDDIDDIILHPTAEKLERVIGITHHVYFDRIYGEYMALKNTGHPISGSVEQVMKLRLKEFAKGMAAKSAIRVNTVDDVVKKQAETDGEIQVLKKQIAELTAMLAQQRAAQDKPTEAEQPTEPAKPKQSATKPKQAKAAAPKPQTKGSAKEE